MGRIIGLKELYSKLLGPQDGVDIFIRKVEDLFEMVLPKDANLDARWPEEYRKEMDKQMEVKVI